jgi:hypothetical protein
MAGRRRNPLSIRSIACVFANDARLCAQLTIPPPNDINICTHTRIGEGGAAAAATAAAAAAEEREAAAARLREELEREKRAQASEQAMQSLKDVSGLSWLQN